MSEEVRTREQFLLERYRYILEQKRTLNGATFRIAATYQALLIATGGGAFAVMERAVNGGLPGPLSVMCLRILMMLILLIGAFGSLMIASGIGSWLKYRRDEAEIESQVYGHARQAPTFRNVFRWYETYIIAMIVLSSSFAAVMLHFFAVPAAMAASS